MNSNNIYEVFGNSKNNEIPEIELKPQNKLNHFDINNSNSKPKIIRDSTSNELISKFFHKRENASPKNSTKLNSRNKKLEFKKLSKSINKNDHISFIFNSSYQDKPELSKNDDSINNLKQKGKIKEYKQKIKLNSFYEKLMPTTIKERDERINNLNKNELNSLDKTNKKAKSVRKFKSEIINNKDSKIHKILNVDFVKDMLNIHGKNLKENLFGQLMTYPQTLAYIIQIEMWLEIYNLEIEI